MKQPDSLAVAVCLVPQLESACTALGNSRLPKPAQPQLNLFGSDEDFFDVAELKNLMVSINSRLEMLEQQ